MVGGGGGGYDDSFVIRLKPRMKIMDYIDCSILEDLDTFFEQFCM
jgi:hypothetical protein